jgi:dihydrolipoamide dehydrogenase
VQTKWQTIVIGGGPGGYSAAIRSAQLGLKTLLVEKGELGGTCLNVGCIPTKYMVELANSIEKLIHLGAIGVNVDYLGVDLERFHDSKKNIVNQLIGGVRALLKHAGVEVIKGSAEFISEHSINVITANEIMEFKSEHFIIAAGTRPKELSIPFDEERVISSTGALSLTELPKSLTIIGAGVIGLEFASIFSQLGVEVSVVEVAPYALINEDPDMVNYVMKALKKRGVAFHFNTIVLKATRTDEGVNLVLEQSGKQISVSSEKVLVAAGRTSNADRLNLEQTKIEIDRGFIKVNATMQTNVKHIYAVGDIVGGWQLAHVAYEEGVIAAETIVGKRVESRQSVVPRSVFTSPELSAVGLTEKQAREQYNHIKAFKIPLQANGKALINGLSQAEGMAKLIVDEEYGEIVGFSIVGEHVNELITDVTSVMSLEGTIEELSDIIHPHPSLSEVIKELALLATGKPLHSL